MCQGSSSSGRHNRLGVILFRRSLREVLQATNVANAIDPVPHDVVGGCGQVVGASRCFHIEDVLELSFHEQSRVHLFALVQVDDALQLATRIVRVVLEQVLARQLSLLQGEPAPSPSLEDGNKGKLIRVVREGLHCKDDGGLFWSLLLLHSSLLPLAISSWSAAT